MVEDIDVANLVDHGLTVLAMHFLGDSISRRRQFLNMLVKHHLCCLLGVLRVLSVMLVANNFGYVYRLSMLLALILILIVPRGGKVSVISRFFLDRYKVVPSLHDIVRATGKFGRKRP